MVASPQQVTPLPPRGRAVDFCSVDGCPRVTHAKGKCQQHYIQMWRRETGRTNRSYSTGRLQPEKYIARSEVAMAKKNGTIVQPPFCYRCGTITEALEAHHWDYSRPLDVGWFCHDCHLEMDRIRRSRAGNGASLNDGPADRSLALPVKSTREGGDVYRG